MKRFSWKNQLPLLLVCIVLTCGACTGRPYLIVDYRVPDASRQLDGQAVRLEVSDRRENPNILAPAAGYHFRDFRDLYSLAYLMPDNQRVIQGEHNLKQLLHESFAKRLKQMGAQIVTDNQSDLPVLSIVLQQLRIDLQNRNWSADLTYEANLMQNGKLITTERVHGNAQRVRVVGRKGADTVFSDIFTDAVNRLDLAKMLKLARPAS